MPMAMVEQEAGRLRLLPMLTTIPMAMISWLLLLLQPRVVVAVVCSAVVDAGDSVAVPVGVVGAEPQLQVALCLQPMTCLLPARQVVRLLLLLLLHMVLHCGRAEVMPCQHELGVGKQRAPPQLQPRTTPLPSSTVIAAAGLNSRPAVMTLTTVLRPPVR